MVKFSLRQAGGVAQGHRTKRVAYQSDNARFRVASVHIKTVKAECKRACSTNGPNSPSSRLGADAKATYSEVRGVGARLKLEHPSINQVLFRTWRQQRGAGPRKVYLAPTMIRHRRIQAASYKDSELHVHFEGTHVARYR